MLGVLLGEASGSSDYDGDDMSGEPRWRVRLSGGRPIVVGASALRRAVPARGDVARCVLGASASLVGEVLSVERGVAVLKVEPEGGAGGGGEERKVRVLPLDALCRIDANAEGTEAAVGVN